MRNQNSYSFHGIPVVLVVLMITLTVPIDAVRDIEMAINNSIIEQQFCLKFMK
jgi:hypothetical protein